MMVIKDRHNHHHHHHQGGRLPTVMEANGTNGDDNDDNDDDDDDDVEPKNSHAHAHAHGHGHGHGYGHSDDDENESVPVKFDTQIHIPAGYRSNEPIQISAQIPLQIPPNLINPPQHREDNQRRHSSSSNEGYEYTGTTLAKRRASSLLSRGGVKNYYNNYAFGEPITKGGAGRVRWKSRSSSSSSNSGASARVSMADIDGNFMEVPLKLRSMASYGRAQGIDIAKHIEEREQASQPQKEHYVLSPTSQGRKELEMFQLINERRRSSSDRSTTSTSFTNTEASTTTAATMSPYNNQIKSSSASIFNRDSKPESNQEQLLQWLQGSELVKASNVKKIWVCEDRARDLTTAYAEKVIKMENTKNSKNRMKVIVAEEEEQEIEEDNRKPVTINQLDNVNDDGDEETKEQIRNIKEKRYLSENKSAQPLEKTSNRPEVISTSVSSSAHKGRPEIQASTLISLLEDEDEEGEGNNDNEEEEEEEEEELSASTSSFSRIGSSNSGSSLEERENNAYGDEWEILEGTHNEGRSRWRVKKVAKNKKKQNNNRKKTQRILRRRRRKNHNAPREEALKALNVGIIQSNTTTISQDDDDDDDLEQEGIRCYKCGKGEEKSLRQRVKNMSLHMNMIEILLLEEKVKSRVIEFLAQLFLFSLISLSTLSNFTLAYGPKPPT